MREKKAVEGGTGTSDSHYAYDLGSIVVDPDDVIETMKRNYRDRDEQRTHVLRVSPPFAGQKRAHMHVSQAHTRYPAKVTKPIHISAEAVVIGHSAGSRHSDFERHYYHPDISEARSEFRDQHNLYDDQSGECLPIAGHSEREDDWEGWWELWVNTWESDVRHALKTTREIVLANSSPRGANVTVPIIFEENSDE
jgi:hypothetical protein